MPTVGDVKDFALRVGQSIHPLLGPIFTGRPSSTGVGDTCTMCIGDTPAAAETRIRDTNGRTSFVCLDHELLLHRTFETNGAGRTAVDDYEAEILREILHAADRPGWMPVPIYEALTKRAQRKARLLAIISVLPKTIQISETRTSQIEATADSVRSSISPAD